MGKKLRLALGLAALVVVSAACAHKTLPQDTLNPQGPYSQQIDDLFTPVFWVAAAVFFIVEGLIVLFLFKYRHRKGQERMPAQIHGNTKLEIGWTILPALVLVVVAVPTVAVIFDQARKPTGNVLNVTVTGHQWWWEFDYTDADMQTTTGDPIKTADELFIPAGRPVYITLSCDFDKMGGVGNAVIHSFWVPQLAGKTDCIPNHTNHMSLQADHPGSYSGQCLEFCGLSHANMRLRVQAMTPEDFATWTQGQMQDGATPQPGSLAAQGLDAFTHGACINCHAVQGTQAAAFGGPNLTHFASRDCFAGCLFDNHDPEQVAAWLRDPPARKPGSNMPNYHLSEDEINALVAYLEQLK